MYMNCEGCISKKLLLMWRIEILNNLWTMIVCGCFSIFADKHKVDCLPSIEVCLEYNFGIELVIRNCDSCTKDGK
jgi:hypothetical protein